MLGLKVAHFHSFIQCCALGTTQLNVAAVEEALQKTNSTWANLLLEEIRSNESAYMEPMPFCMTGPRGASRTTCTGVSWIDFYACVASPIASPIAAMFLPRELPHVAPHLD